MASILFIARRLVLWLLLLAAGLIVWEETIGAGPEWIFVLAVFGTLGYVFVKSLSHVQRVRMLSERVDRGTLASRHRRRIEIPFGAEVAFAMVEAAIRELPHVQAIESLRDSLQVRARVPRFDPYRTNEGRGGSSSHRRNLVVATITPAGPASSLTLVCEPEGGAWIDWLLVDDGSNLENTEAITRAISRRIAERRKGEQADARETASAKELTVAKLSLLQAQVEPHFLYNTLASAQILTRTDPARADRMLGHLIHYLRHSLPRAEESMATLGEEVERARAYLEILRIRMGERLAVQVQVPERLNAVALPPMMLQTLVENAIKHGLEPMPDGGTVWVMARQSDEHVAITVADDGRGFSDEGGGTGIGLRNIRQRLRLAYGDEASLSVVANFPRGVAATLLVPFAGPRPTAHA